MARGEHVHGYDLENKMREERKGSMSWYNRVLWTVFPLPPRLNLKLEAWAAGGNTTKKV